MSKKSDRDRADDAANPFTPAPNWTPLMSTIINSSVWKESKETRLVWITLLAKKDRNGVVISSLWALSRDAGVSAEECREAVKVLESPDPESACREFDGRRIRPIEGGWIILTHFKYRDLIDKRVRLAKQAAWQKEYRRRFKEGKLQAARLGGEAAVMEGLARENHG